MKLGLGEPIYLVQSEFRRKIKFAKKKKKKRNTQEILKNTQEYLVKTFTTKIFNIHNSFKRELRAPGWLSW